MGIDHSAPVLPLSGFRMAQEALWGNIEVSVISHRKGPPLFQKERGEIVDQLDLLLPYYIITENVIPFAQIHLPTGDDGVCPTGCAAGMRNLERT